ncbi:MAG: L-2-amino-thiazoline-4-carboxylic acid hydrolase [Desulfobacteraceae bacterium]|nr:L-2-amino-thiazoline-4-carboxylic acid hydrolase [Desulfobacteraceae bacterium]
MKNSDRGLSQMGSYFFPVPMHEIAKELGNTKLNFLSCHLDDVVFPKIGSEIGFQYIRSETLGNGASYCDFRFKRI